MRILKILFLIFVVSLLFTGGVLFRIPTKTAIVTKTVNDPVVIFKTKTVTERVEVPVYETESNITLYGLAVLKGTDQGELIRITITARAGHGGLYTNIADIVFEQDILESLQLAEAYAAQYADYDTDEIDLFVNFYSSAYIIGGTSSSAATAVAMIALFENGSIREDVVMTGVLEPTGRISDVEYLETKARAAESLGLAKLLIPQSQCNEISKGGRQIEIVCIAKIEDALEHMIV